MPAWEPILEEEERWNVVNFLRATHAPLPAVLAAHVVAAAIPVAPAADPEPQRPSPVTHEDYDEVVRRLLIEQKQMRTEIEQLKRERAPRPSPRLRFSRSTLALLPADWPMRTTWTTSPGRSPK